MNVLEEEPETAAALSHLMELLQCAKCTAIPHEDVYMPFKCEHKYCETCGTQNHTKCFVCKADYTGCIVDPVFTGFLRSLEPAKWGLEVPASKSQNTNLTRDSEKENKDDEEDQRSTSSDDVVYSDDEMFEPVPPVSNSNRRSRSLSSRSCTTTPKSLGAASPEMWSRSEVSDECFNDAVTSDSMKNIAGDKPLSPLKPNNSEFQGTRPAKQRKFGENKQLKEVFGLDLDSEDDDDDKIDKRLKMPRSLLDEEVSRIPAIESESAAADIGEVSEDFGSNLPEVARHSLGCPPRSAECSRKVGNLQQDKGQPASVDNVYKPVVSCRNDLDSSKVVHNTASAILESSNGLSAEVVKPRKFFKSRGSFNDVQKPIEKMEKTIGANRNQVTRKKKNEDTAPGYERRGDPPKPTKRSSVSGSELLKEPAQPEQEEDEHSDFKAKTKATGSRLSRNSRKKSMYIASEDEQDNEEFERRFKKCSNPNFTKMPSGNEAMEVKGRKRNASVSSNGSLNGSFRSITPKGRKSRNQKGETQLHVAARNGNAEKIRILLREGLDVNAKDFADWTPLHEAISSKHPDVGIIKLLCEAGADVNALGGGEMTPLHEAARLGLSEIVEFLLSRKASLALRNSEGKLPRDVAAEDVAALIDSYAATSAASQSTNDRAQLQASLAKAVYYFNYDEDKEVLKSCGSAFGMKISAKLTKDVTHIIFHVDLGIPLSIDKTYIHGMVVGAWMITREWIETSIEVQYLVDPRKFEIPACFFPKGIPSSSALNADGITRSRENRDLKNPGLLQGINIHLSKSTSWPTSSSWESQTAEGFRMNKKELQDLIRLAGGNVVNREPNPENVDPFDMPPRFHAEKDHKFAIICHITLYDESNEPPIKYALEHVKSLKVDWLMHSIVHFKLLDPEPYY